MKKLLIFLLIVLNILIEAFIFQNAWLWFIVPFGVISISLAHAAGFLLIRNFLLIRIKNFITKNTDNKIMLKGQVENFILLIATCVILFLIHLMM